MRTEGASGPAARPDPLAGRRILVAITGSIAAVKMPLLVSALAKRGAEKLWEKINGGAKKGYVNAFGAISAGQAMQQAKAGLEAVYLSGWQVAGDANSNGEMYPDQSLYSVDSVPKVVKKINATFQRGLFAHSFSRAAICCSRLSCSVRVWGM